MRVVFGVPGTQTLAIYDALYGHPRIRHVTVRHEQWSLPLPQPIIRLDVDFVALARALGGRGERVDRPADLTVALQAALRADGPTLAGCVRGKRGKVNKESFS